MQNNQNTPGSGTPVPEFGNLSQFIENQQNEIAKACEAMDQADCCNPCDDGPGCTQKSVSPNFLADMKPVELSEEDKERLRAVFGPIVGEDTDDIEVRYLDDGNAGALVDMIRDEPDDSVLDDITDLYESIAYCMQRVLFFKYGIQFGE